MRWCACVERLRRAGFTPVVACELEFYLLKEEAGGRLVTAGGGRPGERQKIDSYSLQRLDDLAALFDDVYRAATAQGLPAETLMSEYSPGQFEITLHHRDDALRAVDEAVMFKRLLRGVAQKHGLIACFMAKPFTARAGSGLHVHVSLNDALGANLFASEDPAGTPALRHAIGGMRATMAESMAVFAPNANSYRRFVSESYAPIAPIWGINNRTVSLRIPAARPSRVTSNTASRAPTRICISPLRPCSRARRTASNGGSIRGRRWRATATRRCANARCRAPGARRSISPRAPTSCVTRSARSS